MAEYDGVHIKKYRVRGVQYVGLWWYVGAGSRRKSKALGLAKDWTKAKMNRARLAQEKLLSTSPGMVQAGKAPLLSAWLEQYKAMRKDLSEASVSMLDRTVDSLIAVVGDVRIDRISRADAARWRGTLTEADGDEDAMSEATACKYVRTASSLFGERHGAMGLDLVPVNPFSRLKSSTVTAVKGYPTLTDEQVGKLIDASPSPAWRALIALCAWAGVRRGEALAMTWADVLWDQGRLRVPNIKTSGGVTSRDCRMEPALESVLLSCFEQAEGERIVSLPESNLNRDMQAVIKRAGLASWSEPFHALRRRRASLWKMQYPAYVVDAWLGHSAEVSRKHYLSVPEELYESAQHRRNNQEVGMKNGDSK